MKNLSIYVHVPFCRSKCNYCDFYSVPVKDLKNVLAEKYPVYKPGGRDFFANYGEAVRLEIKKAAALYRRGKSKVKSIYFGGGTPSLMPPDFFYAVIESVGKNFKLDGGAEITAEVNPESCGGGKLKDIRAAGINRLSIGIQSFDDYVLKTAGRPHKGKDAARAFQNARNAGFDNISADLIIGLPGQNAEILLNDFKILSEASPEHISAYMLSLEKGTPFHDLHETLAKEPRPGKGGGAAAGGFPSDEETANCYEILCGKMRDYGYIQYEISNFAKKGFESRHNMNYWNRGEYFGFGPSASSFIRIPQISETPRANNIGTKELEIRKTNSPSIKKYLDYVSFLKEGNDGFYAVGEGNKNGFFDIEILNENDIFNEDIFLSLRTARGINAKKLKDAAPAGFADKLIKAGLMKKRGRNIALTVRGMLMSSEILAEIMR